MKINHSKYKNSGILFELLTRQITADILAGKESPAVNILKTHFSNSELGKEYKLYTVLLTSNVLNESKANFLIETTIDLYKRLNKTSLRKQRYNLIKEIKQHYNLEEFFKYKINNYKSYAAAFTLFESSTSNTFINPEDLVKNKVTLLEHLTKKDTKEDTKNQLLESYSESDKGMRYLTYKILVEKFNEKYKELDNIQKDILKEYINNNDNPILLKEYINTKLTDIKKQLKELHKGIQDKTISIKLIEVINLIKPLDKNSHIKDDDVLNLMNYSELIKELKLVK